MPLLLCRKWKGEIERRPGHYRAGRQEAPPRNARRDPCAGWFGRECVTMKFPVALALFGFTSCQVFAAEESPPNVRFIKEQVGDVLTVTVKSDYLTEFT